MFLANEILQKVRFSTAAYIKRIVYLEGTFITVSYSFVDYLMPQCVTKITMQLLFSHHRFIHQQTIFGKYSTKPFLPILQTKSCDLMDNIFKFHCLKAFQLYTTSLLIFLLVLYKLFVFYFPTSLYLAVQLVMLKLFFVLFVQFAFDYF